MREIYIKGEMPKSCWECPCFRPNDLEQPCGLDNEGKGYFLDEIDGGECPLKKLPSTETIIQELKKQLAEKDKIIEQCKHIERYDIGDMLGYMVEMAKKHAKDKLDLLKKVKDFFIEDYEDEDGYKTEDRTITKDIIEVADFIDSLINEVMGAK